MWMRFSTAGGQGCLVAPMSLAASNGTLAHLATGLALLPQLPALLAGHLALCRRAGRLVLCQSRRRRRRGGLWSIVLSASRRWLRAVILATGRFRIVRLRWRGRRFGWVEELRAGHLVGVLVDATEHVRSQTSLGSWKKKTCSIFMLAIRSEK